MLFTRLDGANYSGQIERIDKSSSTGPLARQIRIKFRFRFDVILEDVFRIEFFSKKKKKKKPPLISNLC